MAFCIYANISIHLVCGELTEKVMSHKITALKTQKRNPQRVNVYIDGEFAFGLSRIVATWLQVGQEISEKKILELKNHDAKEVAYQKALNYLSYRFRSELEVRRNLEKKEVSEEIIQKVIERLRKNGLVDDLRFAQLWVENRKEFHPRSRRALAVELHQKGVGDEIIDQVLQDVDDDELAYRVAQKHARKYEQLDWPDFQKKLSGYLSRRGFYYGTIKPIVKDIWSQRQMEDSGKGN